MDQDRTPLRGSAARRLRAEPKGQRSCTRRDASTGQVNRHVRRHIEDPGLDETGGFARLATGTDPRDSTQEERETVDARESPAEAADPCPTAGLCDQCNCWCN